jgi:hypothetical protein
MLDTVQKIINCKFCKAVVKRPVFLPCGETICARHERRFKNAFTAKCKLCKKQHRLAKNQHFPASKVTKRFLKAGINKLEFGEDHKIARELLNELKQLKNDYKNTRNSMGDKIFDRFQEMRRKVDLIREELLQKVTECSEKIIADIDSYESECKANLAELNAKLESKKAFDLAKIKKDLRTWKQKMKNLYYDEGLCKEINENGKQSLERLKNELKQLKNEMFLGEERKNQFEMKYSNLMDTFCQHAHLNT